MKRIITYITITIVSVTIAQGQNLYGLVSSGGEYGGGFIFNYKESSKSTSVLVNLEKPFAKPAINGGVLQDSKGRLVTVLTSGGREHGGMVQVVRDSLMERLPFSVDIQPAGPLVYASDLFFYGVTANDTDKVSPGFLFKVTDDGVAHVVAHFKEAGHPVSGLMKGIDGRFYGVTSDGGAAGRGVVYAITSRGAIAVLHEFTGGTGDGDQPSPGTLVQGANGAIYGTTSKGGTYDEGVAYSITPDGQFSVLQSFSAAKTGSNPYGLVWKKGSDNILAGVAQSGGFHGKGTIFFLNLSTGIHVLHHFEGGAADGANPMITLTQGNDGTWYGATKNGGPTDEGAFFSLRVDGFIYTVNAFFSATPGSSGVIAINPSGAMYTDPTTGKIYGTAQGGAYDAGIVYYFDPSVNAFHTINAGYSRLGYKPTGIPLYANNDLVYVTTQYGGLYNDGTIFSVDASGYTSVIHDFNEPVHGTHQDQGAGGLIQAQDGALYGVTPGGGRYGFGTLFRIAIDGAFSVLHHFSGENGDGSVSYSTLAQGYDGILYGITDYGGEYHQGTLFSFNPRTLEYTTIHSFSSENGHIGSPNVSLLAATDGNLYGVGATGGIYLAGGIFMYQPQQKLFKEIKSFGSSEAVETVGKLMEDDQGVLYGVSPYGISGVGGFVYSLGNIGNGSFQLNKSQTSQWLYPYAGLIQASDGFLYGTTLRDSVTNNYGGLFRFDKKSGVTSEVYKLYGGQSGYQDVPLIGVVEVSNANVCHIQHHIPVNFSICPGHFGAIDIRFTATGHYLDNTVFRLELGDRYGNFSGAITIGSLRSVTSGTIHAEVPEGLAPGMYTLRIIANDYKQTSTAAVNVTIKPTPALPTRIVPDGCFPEKLNLTTLFSGVISTGTLAFTYAADSAGKYPVATPAAVDSGRYYIMATDTVTGCIDSTQVVYNTVWAKIDSVIVVQPVCSQVNSGSISIYATGNSSIRYSIDGMQHSTSDNIFNNRLPGTYQPMIEAVPQSGGNRCPAVYDTQNAIILHTATAPVFTGLTDINLPAAGLCGTPVQYSPDITGAGTVQVSFQFTGATSGAGNGTGSGALFNPGITTVVLTATNDCGSTIDTFHIKVADPLTVQVQQPDCKLGKGGFIITSNVSQQIEISIDRGMRYFTDGTFSNLPPGSYWIFARPVGVYSCIYQYNLGQEITLYVPDPSTCPSATAASRSAGSEPSARGTASNLSTALTVTALGNPAIQDFHLQVTTGDVKTPVGITLRDMTGRVVSNRANAVINGVTTISTVGLSGGSYIATVTQGNARKVLKLVLLQ